MFSVIIYELLKYRSKIPVYLLILISVLFTVAVLSNDRIKSNFSDLFETIFFGVDSDKEYDDRIYIWRGSVSAVKDNFWIGAGVSNTDTVLTESFDKQVVASVSEPFKADGGLSVLCGNLGRAVMKTSALREPHCKIKAPAQN